MADLKNAELLDAKGKNANEKRNVATVRAIFEGFSSGNMNVLGSYLAKGGKAWVVGFTPEKLPPKMKNPNFLSELFCNGMQFTVKQVAVDGNLVVVEWDDDAVTKDGKRYQNNGCSLFVFNDEGKISSYHEYMDPDKFFAVL